VRYNPLTQKEAETKRGISFAAQKKGRETFNQLCDSVPRLSQVKMQPANDIVFGNTKLLCQLAGTTKTSERRCFLTHNKSITGQSQQYFKLAAWHDCLAVCENTFFIQKRTIKRK
jgi:hypothetical protein